MKEKKQMRNFIKELDSISRDLEKTAGLILEDCMLLSEVFMQVKCELNAGVESVEKNKMLIEILHKKFPQINSFSKAKKWQDEALEKIQETNELSKYCTDILVNIEENLQSHDLMRQRVERVINEIKNVHKIIDQAFSDPNELQRVSTSDVMLGDDDDILGKEDLAEILKSINAK